MRKLTFGVLVVFPLLVSAVVVALAGGTLAGGLRRTAVEQPRAQVQAVTPQAEARALDSYARLPLSFVPNAGQTDATVRFHAEGAGYSFYFTPDAAVLAFTKAAQGKQDGVALHLSFPGANPTPIIEGVQRGTGTVSYFRGQDPAGWQTGLATYNGVAYRDLWPGIDMLFRGHDGQLKYEFRVARGADPSNIRLAYVGAESLSVGGAGSLLVGTPLGALTDARPLAYQSIDGRTVPVESGYALSPRAGEGLSYGFALGAHDPRFPLVIDPGLAYSTYLGGTGRDTGFGVALDGDGNAYITGFTESRNFPTTAGAFDVTPNGSADLFVTKLDDEGSALIYSTYVGSSGFDLGQDIAVDERGNAYVVGFTDASDFPTTQGAFQQADPGPGPSPEGDDGVVVKLNRSGTRLDYSTYLGGPGEDTANGVGVDEQGNAYVGSSGETSAFPTTPGAFQETDPGPGDPQDAMLSKLNARGTALVFATYLGGAQCDILNTMTVDRDGHIHAAGSTGSSDFPTTAGAFQETEPGPGPGPDVPPCARDDGWVAKLNATGSALDYGSYLGGTGDEEGVQGIGVDQQGHAYVFGRTDSSLDFPTTPDAYDTSYNGGFNDTFVTKFITTGTGLVYSTFLGGSGFEQGSFAVAVDRDGRASVSAETDSTDFPTTPGAYDTTYNGGARDAFVTTLNPAGDTLAYSSYLGGSGTDIAFNVAVDRHGNPYVTGRTNSVNFPTTPGAFDASRNDPVRDAFVTKFEID